MKTALVKTALALLLIPAVLAAKPIELENRLEPFFDGALIESKTDGIIFKVHRPEPKEVVLTADAPWEGNTSGYFGVFQEGDIYRMYYRGWQHDPADIKKQVHPEITCYAESRDGIHFVKPKLGLFEFEGSKENNIIWMGQGTHNFAAFKDGNPATKLEARYRGFGGARGKGRRGLLPFQSADGLRWELSAPDPVITAGAFDSQNLAFWDAHRGQYRAYWRIFTNKVRAIRTATSRDFMTWENQVDLTYAEGTPSEHLYTNAVLPYFRAPHLFVGFPTRFLRDQGERTEPVFMVSRDGAHFTRHGESVIPEDAPEDRKGNRSNYMAWGMVQLPGQTEKISVYATEAYYGPVPGRLRRFEYRVDGFASLSGTGTVTTKVITFSGSKLTLNHAGSVRVEVLDAQGQAMPGLVAELKGDATGAAAGLKLAGLAGKPIRLRLTLAAADVFSLRFE